MLIFNQIMFNISTKSITHKIYVIKIFFCFDVKLHMTKTENPQYCEEQKTNAMQMLSQRPDYNLPLFTFNGFKLNFKIKHTHAPHQQQKRSLWKGNESEVGFMLMIRGRKSFEEHVLCKFTHVVDIFLMLPKRTIVWS